MIEVNKKVIEILKDLSGVDEIRKTDSLKDDLGLDSLHMVSLIILLEEALDTELDESDMNPFALITVSDVIALAEKYTSKAGGICNG